ncbi:MAG: SPOR domain-containing protein [Panacagrimonas sp.]
MLKYSPSLAALSLLCVSLGPLALGPAGLAPIALGPALTVAQVEGEVYQSRGSNATVVARGQTIDQGAQIKAPANGRVELSVDGYPTIAIGNGGELSFDGAEALTLRLTLSRGAIHVDTRPRDGQPQRDVKILLGDVEVRVNGAEVWAALNNDIAQVCLIAGMAEAQVPSRTDRLDLLGQCMSRAGLESRWVMVPVEVLDERTALLHVRVKESIAAQPALPDLRKASPTVGSKPVPTVASLPEVAVASTVAAPSAVVSAVPPPPVTPTAAVKIAAPVVDTPRPPATESANEPPARAAPAAAPPPAPSPAKASEPGLRWSVVLASLDSRDAAEMEAVRLRKQGVNVEIREYARDGKRGFRVGHGRFGSHAEAQAAWKSLKKSHPKLSGWMANY